MSYERLPEQLEGVNPNHIGLLNATLQAPSAHNAQPWQIKPRGDNRTYEIHYDQNDTLPEDPDSKDAYLTMGAFVETMALQAPNHNLSVDFTPELTQRGNDIFIGNVAIDGYDEGATPDPLRLYVNWRHTNRNRYTQKPLPSGLETDLELLGNTLVAPKSLKEVIQAASRDVWASHRYIEDLKYWFRANNDAEDGITPAPFNLSKTDILGLKFAFWKGSLKSEIMRGVYAAKDVSVFESSPAAAVLAVPEMTPPVLFEAGRRLLRSWVNVVANGYSYQPFSVAVDNKESAAQVAEVAGVEGTPVALYRVGKTHKEPHGYSNRKSLGKVLI